MFTHGYIASKLSDVYILPTLKNNLNDPGQSGNYRPIGVASVLSKIIENVILDRIRDLLTPTWLPQSSLVHGYLSFFFITANIPALTARCALLYAYLLFLLRYIYRTSPQESVHTLFYAVG